MDIKGFLASVGGLSANTRRAYEQTLWQVNHVIKGSEPTREDILAFLHPYTSSSLHRHKAAIKAYLEYTSPGQAWPFTRRQFAAPRHHILRYVPREVVEQIRDTTENEDERMYVWTLFLLGCRINELMGIEEKDILPNGVQVLTKGGRYKLKPITPDFYQELSAYAGGKKGRIFPHPYTHYYNTLKRLATAVGHPEVSPHMLRHARAVDLLRKKMPLPFVQQFLGHANINTTAAYLEITGGELGEELMEAEGNGLL